MEIMNDDFVIDRMALAAYFGYDVPEEPEPVISLEDVVGWIFDGIDTNNDQYLSLEEGVATFTVIARAAFEREFKYIEQGITEMLDMLGGMVDADGNSLIDVEEFQGMVRAFLDMYMAHDDGFFDFVYDFLDSN